MREILIEHIKWNSIHIGFHEDIPVAIADILIYIDNKEKRLYNIGLQWKRNKGIHNLDIFSGLEIVLNFGGDVKKIVENYMYWNYKNYVQSKIYRTLDRWHVAGVNLYLLRKLKGYSLFECAKRLNISPIALWKIEKGVFDLDIVDGNKENAVCYNVSVLYNIPMNSWLFPDFFYTACPDGIFYDIQ